MVNYCAIPEKTYTYTGSCVAWQNKTYRSKGRVSPIYKGYGLVEVFCTDEHRIFYIEKKEFTKSFKQV